MAIFIIISALSGLVIPTFSENNQNDIEELTATAPTDLSTTITWVIDINQGKKIDINYIEFYDYVENGYVHENYFKTGNYFAWHDDYEKAAQVTLHRVIREHID